MKLSAYNEVPTDWLEMSLQVIKAEYLTAAALMNLIPTVPSRGPACGCSTFWCIDVVRMT